MPRLSQIWTYPVKSCAGVRLGKATLGPRGLAYDRHWMVVDQGGRMVTMRSAPALARVRPRFGRDHLVLSAPEMPPLELPYGGEGRAVQVELWDGPAGATALSDASAWFGEYLGRDALLVAVSAANRRTTSLARGSRPLSFVDDSPLNLLGEASLADLNRRLETPVGVERFRPNLVIAGSEPYAEDTWRRVRIGPVSFAVDEPCDRCMVVNVSEDGVYAKAPLAALARYRRQGKRVFFGQSVSHLAVGELAVGDELEVLA